jgi:diacylglycerol kinase
LFGYCFVASVTVTVGLVVGIGVLQWAVVILSLSVAASAEMFQMVLRSIGNDLADRLSRPTQKALQIGSAAVVVTRLGAGIAVGLIYVAAIREMW